MAEIPKWVETKVQKQNVGPTLLPNDFSDLLIEDYWMKHNINIEYFVNNL